MSLAEKHDPGRPGMPIGNFRVFQATRPDEERWELVDGAPMTPTFITRAGNAGRLVSDALDAFDPSRIALHEIGVDLEPSDGILSGLGRSAGYAPQPDVAAIHGDSGAELRFGIRWIDAETRVCQVHAACETVVAIEQGRLKVCLSPREGAARRTAVLTRAEDAFVVPTCGLACKLAALHRGTPPLRSRAAG